MLFRSTSLNWFRVALLYWLITSLLGLFLRALKSGFLSSFTFDYFLHTHSHLAMLGWVYMALITAIICVIFGENGFKKWSVKILFGLTQVAILGMLFTFPFQGYGTYSIAFSTLHILLSYSFTAYLWKHWNPKTFHLNPLVRKFLAGSLVFMVFSSFGPWALAYIGAQGWEDTHWYDQSIYFYLHFQYNGWFTFALMGLGLYHFNVVLTEKALKKGKKAFWFLFWATIPAYFLSLLNFNLPLMVEGLAIVSSIVQLFAFLFLLALFKNPKKRGLTFTGLSSKILFYLALISVLVKFCLQTMSAIPAFYPLAFGSRDIIVAYLHLVMLGFVSSGLVFWFLKARLIPENTSFKMGLWLYLVGFATMEGLLAFKGIFQPFFINYWVFEWVLMAFTFLLITGILLFLWSALIKQHFISEY